ncbi:MAG: E3 binding domain-containing protein, partial [Aggregatilineales bacterium]
MATPVVLPKQGNSVEACLIMAWKKQVGDVVKPGEVLVEVETDKAVVEVASEEAGVLLAQFFADGDEVPVMTNIAVVGQQGDDIEQFRPELMTSAPQKTSQPVNSIASTPVLPVSTKSTTSDAIFISPRARLLADKHNLTLQNITPTGPDGRIIERDIQAAIQSQGQLTRSAKALASQNGVTVPQSGT